MMKILEALVSLFKKRKFSFQTNVSWRMSQAEEWLSSHSFEKFKDQDFIWVLKRRVDSYHVSFCVRVLGDGKFTSAVLALRPLGNSHYWCSKEQRYYSINPVLALKSSLSFLDIDVEQNADDIFNCGDLISRFLSDRRRWNDSNTSSRFLHLNQNRYR